MTQPDTTTQPSQPPVARVVIACLLAALTPLSLIGAIALGMTRDSQYMPLAITLFALGGCLPLFAGLLFNDVRVKRLQRRAEEAQAYNQTTSTAMQSEKKKGKDWWMQKVPSNQLVLHSLFLPIAVFMMHPERPIFIFLGVGFSLVLVATLVFQVKAEQREEGQRRNGSYNYPPAFGHTRPRFTDVPKKTVVKISTTTPAGVSALAFITVILYITTWSGLNLLLVLFASLTLTVTLILNAGADKCREQNELRRIYLGEDS